MKVPDRSIVILDVGHGNSAIVQENGKVIIIDAGRKSGLLEYLTQQAVQQISFVLISHADADHIGGLIALISSGYFDIEAVRVNSDALQASTLWDTFIRAVDDANINFNPALTPTNNGEYDLDTIQLEILGPSNYLATKSPGSKDRNGNIIQTNSISVVIRVMDNGNPVVLLPGDLDFIGLNELNYKGVDSKAPILVFPHHGGRARKGDMREFTNQIIDCVHPTTVIFSVGRSQNPRPEIVKSIRENNSDVRIICTELSENCGAHLPELDPQHLHGAFSLGKENNRCCGGTIVIDLDDSIRIFPEEEDHKNFIFAVAPTRMCLD